MIRDALANENCEIETACDGLEGIAKFCKRSADIVITDVYMPEKNGLALIRELRSKYRGIKIIAMSGGYVLNSRTSLQFAKNIGADCCFSKPVDLEKLIEVIREYSNPKKVD